MNTTTLQVYLSNEDYLLPLYIVRDDMLIVKSSVGTQYNLPNPIWSLMPSQMHFNKILKAESTYIGDIVIQGDIDLEIIKHRFEDEFAEYMI